MGKECLLTKSYSNRKKKIRNIGNLAETDNINNVKRVSSGLTEDIFMEVVMEAIKDRIRINDPRQFLQLQI